MKGKNHNTDSSCFVFECFNAICKWKWTNMKVAYALSRQENTVLNPIKAEEKLQQTQDRFLPWNPVLPLTWRETNKIQVISKVLSRQKRTFEFLAIFFYRSDAIPMKWDFSIFVVLLWQELSQIFSPKMFCLRFSPDLRTILCNWQLDSTQKL